MSDYTLSNASDFDIIVSQWCGKNIPYPDDRTIQGLFEEQVLRTPGSIALVYGSQELSYDELNRRSNALARHIRSCYEHNTGSELTADTLVALCVERSLEMIVGILAVLKAGGAYVPIDPGYPQERIDYILSDTGAALILSLHSISSGGGVNLPEDKVVNIDFAEALYANATDNLPAYSNAGNLAYVIYTSGTTGQPKGVMVEHRSVVSLVYSDYISVRDEDVFLFLSSPVFDAATFEIWTPLLKGNLLVVARDIATVTSGVEDFKQLLHSYHISILWLTKTLFDSLFYIDPTVFKSLQYLIIGGEALDKVVVSKLANAADRPVHFLNGYGPTESTTFTCTFDLTKPFESNNVPIGAPIANRAVYVLDNALGLVPVGVIGELYIGGAGLARGYWNRPELTKERFIANPFASEDARLYKTGDLVRWLPDGNLEYMGRNDDQVKIRGYRIELGEVEHALLQVKGIRHACVLAKDRETLAGSHKYLVGYYVLDNDYVSNDYAQIVDSWESLYNSTVYEKELEGQAIEADFSGWNSYITQTPIPLLDMKAWQAEIVGVIKSLRPSRVLEIGVGSGLLMYPLLNEIQRYVGLDFSLPVINRHKAYLKDKQFDVDLYRLRADQLDQLSDDELYDTIIVNSVCQYFPSIFYFNEMLEKALAKLADGGSVFLGDIRNYDLHKELLAARLDHEGTSYTQQDVDQLALKENELLISPSYFIGLQKKYNNINVVIHDRKGDYENELSRFRYDVIISKAYQASSGASDILPSGGFNVPFLNQLSKTEIFNQLSAVLPEYMVPSTLVALESMPLTLNGKLDKRSLPEPVFGGADYVAATTELEKVVCNIWQEVMGLEQVGVTDNFFRIGGNSILAIQVSHRMTRALGKEVRVADVFKHKTVAELLGHDGVDGVQVNISCVGGNTGVLSFAQERLWFIEQYEEGTNAYHIPAVFELLPSTDVSGIRYALQQIIARHEVLRSTIERGEEGSGIQVVHNEPLVIGVVELTDLSELNAQLKADINQPFDLNSSYPIRAKFYTLAEGIKRFLLINVHHIASDGWSTEVFQRELNAYYSAYVQSDLSFRLPPLEIQYKDYARWQRSWLTGDVLSHQLSYWKQKLSGYQTLELPTDYVRPAQIDYRGASERFVISSVTSARLRALVRAHGITLQGVLLSSISILLGKYSGQHDIVIGSPIANRHHRQTRGLIGFFVNTQVHRMLLNDNQSYEELLLQVHQDQAAAQLHQDLPFEKLVDELEVERDASRHPVFQVLFVVQSFGEEARHTDQQQDYLSPYNIEEGYTVARFDLSILIDDSREEIIGEISYATGLFTRSSIIRMIDHYVRLLDQLLLAPQVAHSTFSLLSPSEHAQLLNWNATDAAYPDDCTMQMLFEEQVLRTPRSIALAYEDQELSYEELNRRSNALARHIRSCYKEFTADTLVALCVDRGLEMIVGILAVLKAGGAYVPIDPGYPQERIDYILSDTGAALILSQRSISAGLPADKVVNIDLSEELYTSYATDNLPACSNAGNLAYVIYTSGTTGKPKGVMVEHRSLINLIFAKKHYIVNETSRVLQFASLVFDPSIWELSTALLNGATLFIAPAQVKQDVTLLWQYLSQRKISFASLPPVMLAAMPHEGLERLTTLIAGGEVSSLEALNKWTRGRGLFNAYGPTESTVIATLYKHAVGDSPTKIGKPLSNCRVYVLDSNHVAVPVGVPGELYIGGAGVARGYLNRPELTKERFITNPFAPDDRLYKTGDLVRWLPDGNLEYLGRNDDQVKIRGYRIELGEVEHVLLQVAGIRQGCILAKERTTAAGNVKYLVGYYVGESSLQESWILEEMSRSLPEYMVPSILVALESLPMTLNGKVDKRSLPDPVFGGTTAEYVAPTTEQEEVVCGIWQEVLGVERVGITDNFFRTGGNSILAIQVSHRMTRALGYDVRVADIFKHKSIAQLLKHGRVDGGQVNIPYEGGSVGVLSFAQERLWFIEQYEEGTNAYHIPQVFELHPSTDVAGIQYALQQIIARHEVLRSTIEQGEDGVSIQVVHPEPLLIDTVELSDLSELDSLLKADINQPFDLRRSYPVRIRFYTLPEQFKRFLLINVHHIASDGWSMEIFQRELKAYDSAYVRGDRSFSLPPLEIQYKDYATWQRSYLTGEVLSYQLNYWKDKLSGYQTLELPTDYPRPAKIDYRGASERFVLSAATSARLRALVRKHGTTLHSALLGSLSIFLSKYSGLQDIVIGSPIANRHHRQTEALIGFFVNTQAHRMLLNDSQCFEELLLQIHQDQVAAQLHQDLPFEKLVEELDVARDPSRHPVFQVMLALQRFDDLSSLSNQDHLLPYNVEAGYAVEKFDLSIFIDDSGEEILGKFSYATGLFARSSIIRMIDHYVRLLDQLLLTPQVAHSTISLLNASEHAQLLSWNVTDAAYSDDRTIQGLFEDQVLRTPGSIALVYEGQELSYEELNRRSNALARHIRSCHERNTGNELTADTLVALCVERGLEMIVGILAVLKAGGAYVPIDPGYPQERIDYILSDTGASLILSQRSISACLPADKVVNIDLSEELYTRYATDNLPAYNNALSLAYVIYTSGTTGQPKGVMVEHRSVVSLVYSNYISVRDEDVFLFLSSPVFDAATFEIWMPLLKGNLLVVARDIATVTSGVGDFKQLLHSYNISILWLTKTLFDSLFYVDPSIFKCLQYLIIGGEALDKAVVSKLANAADRPVHFLNGYGPTESTTFTCTFDLTKPFESNNVPIGAPIANRSVYVLDNALGLVPVGVIGELYIGGAGLARGYWNRPELTKERFIANPFVSEDARLYKTGDLVRWLPDGNLEYLGRNDDQVKIRGYRIELGEVEHALLQVKGIRQGCVLVKERTTAAGRVKYLVGYYVGESSLQESWILEELSRKLPEYMVPSTLVALETMPMTQNGKLDKRSLPEPVLGGTSAEYVAATTEQEKLVCGIWQEVLGVARVGITDNFFRVGGNSILAIQVSHRMSRALGYDVRVSDIFKHKSIAQLLGHDRGDGVQVNIPCVEGSTGVLSFAQERLWFIEQYEEGTNAYHIPQVFELPPFTDIAGVQYALQQIIARHEVLRSTIERGSAGSGIQVVHSAPLVMEAVELISLSELDALLKTDINQPFDLSNSYPIRIKFYTLPEGIKRFLLINVHHIASDGWSTEIFQRELMAYYSAYVQEDRSFSLPPLEIQYKDYATWQRSYLTGEVLSHQLSYWKGKLSGYQTLELPTDYIRPAQTDYRGASEHFVLSEATSARLRTLVRAHGTTLHSAMLSSISILLGKYSGQQDIVIGSPIANRHHRQTEALIGFFVNTQVHRMLLSDRQSYEELLLQVHQDQAAAQLHQDLPFERLVEELGVERDTSRHPVFQVFFVVQSFGEQIKHTDKQQDYFSRYNVGEGYAVEKFDLSIFIDDSGEEIRGELSYATSLFSRSTILRMIDHYVRLLDQLLLGPKVAYSTFSLLSASEHAQLLNWNATEAAYPDDRTIHVLFEEQVLRTPESIALAFEGQQLSYDELNRRSNALARHIRSCYERNNGGELTADTLVALCVERGLEMIVGILAVLKAGGAYVPIDPGYPQERIDYILSDTGAALILSQRSISAGNRVLLPVDKVVNIDLAEAFYTNYATDNLPSYSSAGDLVYVIYTSGTTGRPKGVMLEHFSVCNRINYIIERSAIGPSDVYLFKTNYVFDASFFEVFTHLCVGARVQITRSVFDIEELTQLLLSDQFTSLHLVPSQYELVASVIKRIHLSKIYFSGEALTATIVSDIAGAVKIYNYYGPTEAGEITVSVPSVPADAPVIGKIFPNCRAYVLDSSHVAVPVGVPGELYIGGAGIARGYWNRPELTKERFITNPFASEFDVSKGYTRLYKTGDLVRWLPDGNLLYMGRNDDQVKIRGYRIELGEVEHALLQVAGIRQGCVLVKERETLAGSHKYLVGYYVGESSLQELWILEELSRTLPEYMVPSTLVALESLPLTQNGKLDKRALPEPVFGGTSDDYAPATTEQEELVCGIWQELLGVERVGITDNFFRIGGNSILAIQVSHRMTRALGYEIRVADIFKHKTIAQLVQLHANDQLPSIMIPVVEENAALLSFAQERLWFIEQYEEGTNAYHIPQVFELHPSTNVVGIQYALQQIIARHEVLRSTIEQGSTGSGIQVVHSEPLVIDAVELTDRSELNALLKADINQPFDLRNSYPIRVKFYTLPEGAAIKQFLLINIHHIASDGWSTDVFQRELMAYYSAYVQGDQSFSLPPQEIQYKDYAMWQRSYLTGEVLTHQLNYWKQKLSGYQTLELPTDYVRPAKIDYRGAWERFVLSGATNARLRALVRTYGTTLHSALLSSLSILLGKYSGQQDIVIGSPIANRHHRQTRELIGFFVNTQVHRMLLSDKQSYEELLLQVHLDQAAAQLYQDLPFEKLVEELEVERDASRHPVFQVMFVVQSFGAQIKHTDQQHAHLLPYNDVEESYAVEKFDLSIFIDDSGEEIVGEFSYATSLFSRSTILRMIDHYVRLLDQLVLSPKVPYSTFSLLSPPEHTQLLNWNATEAAYPDDRTMHMLFEEQVMRNPGAVALVYEDQELSYEELNRRSNALARHIRSCYKRNSGGELTADTLVALCVDRGLEMIVGVLAVLKAGGAYVPIDPGYPQERIDYILSDTGAALILSQCSISVLLPADKVMNIDLTEELYTSYATDNLPTCSNAGDLAYVIYTSGTTGQPKGVMIEHRSLINLIFAKKHYSVNETSRVLQFASPVFDASVWELSTALLSGATLFIAPAQVRQDVTLLWQYLSARKITLTLLPPVVLASMPHEGLESLTTLIVGGEVSSLETLNRWTRGRELINAYGPTESTVIATMHKHAAGDAATQIGKPLSNCRVYVLDSNHVAVPVGVPGELYIGGAGVARGYLNRPELTRERFITNPFASVERLYKTGDLVRWLPDGNLEYLGRNDDQVKIRGYRIELGEVEHALLQVKGIRQGCVLVKDRETLAGSHKYLVGYYVGESSLQESWILEEMSRTLPEYMVPSTLVALESMPLTLNGKLDKRSLPEPVYKKAYDNEPQSELAKIIHNIFAEVLGRDKSQIGIDQNFFKIGGNSILSIQLKARLNEINAFKNVTIADVFKNNTIARLLKSVHQSDDRYELSPKHINYRNPEIAIIAASGAFSGVNNVDEFWDLISNQKEGTKLYTRNELRDLKIDESLVNDLNYIPVGGKIEDIELFDPFFWEMSPNEAKQLNPQIRKFVEHCWRVLESAGYAHQREHLHIGVFAGSGENNYLEHHVVNGELSDQINAWEANFSNSKDALSTRTAYLLNLKGPAYSINTACSTGLVTIIEGCKNLRLGTCNLALAGGVSLSLPDEVGYTYEEGMIVSEDGHCRPFDKYASGTTKGSGVGVVLLKRLEDAINDNDEIIGVIKGYATNNDGARKTGYTAPSVEGQRECIIDAQKMAGITADQIDYVECHGTATAIGDPIEVQALKEAFEFNKDQLTSFSHKTKLGAVKANIGHTDSAAGTAGVIKVCAMLKHGLIPGQANYSEPNPLLNIENTNFEIAGKNVEWLPGSSRQRLAGVSAFGIGGTNAHVIIGDHKSTKIVNEQTSLKKYIIPISARSKNSLDKYRSKLIEFLQASEAGSNTLLIQDLAYTLQERRPQFAFRSAYQGSNIADLIQQLKLPPVFSESVRENKVVFMFPGQGPQYKEMCAQLYQNEQAFREVVDICITLANQYLQVDLHDVIYSTNGFSTLDINEIRWSSISLFIIEYSLASYLEGLGIKPDCYIGHSIGEYVAATLSGVFSLEDAIKIVCERGRLMQSMSHGAMLAIVGDKSVWPVVQAHGCEIAAINSHSDIVASGEMEAIAELKKSLEKINIQTIEIGSNVAGHSKMMEPSVVAFAKVFEHVKMSAPKAKFVSNITGELAGEEVTKIKYWCNQLRNTVEFAKGVECISKQFDYKVTFLEVGPGKGLSYFVNQYAGFNKHKFVKSQSLIPSLKDVERGNGYSDYGQLNIMAKLWMAGFIDKPNYDQSFVRNKVVYDLPTYQFDSVKTWLNKAPLKARGKYNSNENLFYERAWERIRLSAGQGISGDKNIVIFLNDNDPEQSGSARLLNIVHTHFPEAICVINVDPLHISDILDRGSDTKDIDIVLYISPTIDLLHPSLDILAVRNMFDWSKKTGKSIAKFVSVSFDNYEVTGTEQLVRNPSIVYGVSKSIPFEYFTSGCTSIHVDLLSTDNNYESALLAILQQDHSSNLLAVRGKYQWIPTYQHRKIISSAITKEAASLVKKTSFLITGGLGAIGYAYAAYLARTTSDSLIVLIGRTEESRLSDKKLRQLRGLKELNSNVIYLAVDIAQHDSVAVLCNILRKSKVEAIDLILHTAVVVAKSAAAEKSVQDIENVIWPKIAGVENLIKLGSFIPVKDLVTCSSLSSILPSLGQMEYTCANLYLDELSQRIHPNIDRMITVNLNQVSDAGAAVDFISNSTSQQGRIANSIKTYEFTDILNQLLRSSFSNNIALSRYDLNEAYLINENLLKSESEVTGILRKVRITDEVYTNDEYKVAQIFGDILGLELISKNDNFFNLGGNSILAIQVSHRVTRALGYDVRVADVFKHPSIAELVLYANAQLPTIRIPAVKDNATLLSFAQERLWFIEQYEEGTNAYHIPQVFELPPYMDVTGILYSLQQIVARHEVLRSTIERGSAGGIQVVHNVPLIIDTVELTDRSELDVLLKADINQPFDLSHSYPIRVKFYTLPDKRFLLINVHHIAGDGWSMEVFQRELKAYYSAYKRGDRSFSLPSLEIQYKDYAKWQRSYLTGEVLAHQLSYWKDKLSGFQTLELPTDYVRPAQTDYRGASAYFVLSAATSARLRALVRTYGTTLHSALLSSISILLGKYSGQQDIVTGSLIANRHHRQTRELIGFFVNTQVNRMFLSDSQSYEELLLQVHQDQAAAQLHQDLPFEKLVEELDVERDPSRHPVFQVLFVVQSFGEEAKPADKQQDYLLPYGVEGGYAVEKFDLSIFINDREEEIRGEFSYATSLFSRNTILRMIDHYVRLLDQLLLAPKVAYSTFSLLSASEHAQLLEWNTTDKAYPDDRTIHVLFEEQVFRNPGSIALVYEDQQLSYDELNRRSNALARHIRSFYGELRADTLVALCVERSLEMIVGILAVLKAGGAYVPIDPGYPQERIDYILSDTGAALILSQRSINASLPADKVVNIDLTEEFYTNYATDNLPAYSNAKDLVYVIYTSGTTGRPKGVMLEHFSICNRINYIIERSAIVPSDVYLFKTNYVFDASFFEVFTHLCVGARVQITRSVFDIEELTQLLLSDQFTSLHLVPSQYELVAAVIKRIHLSKIYFSGEALTAKIVSDIAGAVKIYNYYGPTEAGEITVLIPSVPADAPVIGKIFPNCRAYVLDSSHVAVPVGVIGELYIGGAGIARGYWNRPELTKERFITNPFASEYDRAKGYTRLYKTGDLVRWLPDGNLVYMGRNDDQVKIRGYRIELGEVEQALLQVAGIRQGCVLVKERITATGTVKYLVGYYYVGESSLQESWILEELSRSLPEYMVPSILVALESLPLTQNGKLDKRALPEPVLGEASENYVAATTEQEEMLCGIWKEVLGVERVGITDNFFRIGGNSILAIQVSHRMTRALEKDIRVIDVFKHKTIRDLLINIVSPSLADSNVIWKF